MSPGRVARWRNDLWREFGYQRGHVRLRNQPAVFAVESTNHCNLRCVMCPRGEPDLMDRPLGTMSDDVFERVLDEARYFTDPCWFHWFGEPLLHPRLFEQIDRAKSRGAPNLGISTNGTLLDDRRSRAIFESPLDTLMIAIDGASKEVYERIRLSPRHQFEEVVANARSFLAARRARGGDGPHTILSIIVMEETQSELAEFESTWRAAGADEVLFKPFTTWANQTDGFVELGTAAVRSAATARREFPCHFLWESFVVAWDGRVLPCCNDYNAVEVLGDLRSQTFAEIWNGEAYQRLRRKELDGRNDSPLCSGCNQAPGHARDRLWPLRR